MKIRDISCSSRSRVHIETVSDKISVDQVGGFWYNSRWVGSEEIQATFQEVGEDEKSICFYGSSYNDFFTCWIRTV
jgi:hypothetical protein